MPPIYRRAATSNNDSSTSSDSDRYSQSTVPTSIPSLNHGSISSAAESDRDVRVHYESSQESSTWGDNARASVNTYCSTVPSFDEALEDDDEGAYGHYNYYDYYEKAPRNEAVPATPAEFAQLFPSIRRFQIRHDDASADGDMNIRVDTNLNERGGMPQLITIFHLRMYDLQKREFSLRRYGRDCGREVAHTHQKKPETLKRPGLQRSVSKAFQSFRSKSPEVEKPQAGIVRQDSGYGSSLEDEDGDCHAEKQCQQQRKETETTTQCNAIAMEFSNYAHVCITRKGTRATRKYDFEYWGKNYSWKRLIRKNPATAEDEISYQLVNNASDNIVAVILPDPVSPMTETINGEFVPPCSFYLKDSLADPINGPADVADVIMTTGLMALVDDCIKRKFRQRKMVQLNIPLPMTPNKRVNLEYVGPKRLIDEVFNRRPTMHMRSMSVPISSPNKRR